MPIYQYTYVCVSIHSHVCVYVYAIYMCVMCIYMLLTIEPYVCIYVSLHMYITLFTGVPMCLCVYAYVHELYVSECSYLCVCS